MTNSLRRRNVEKQVVSMDMISEQRKKESNVGKKLTDFTTRKVIIIVLFMLFTNPLKCVDKYSQSLM